MSFSVGDRVRVRIAEADDVDAHLDGAVGRIIAVFEDDLGTLTGDLRDDRLYQVEFAGEECGRMTFRHHDLTRLDEGPTGH